MSLIGGRRLPSQLLVGLEGSGGGRWGSGGSAGRLSDPFRPSTSSIRASTLPAGVLPTVHQGSRLNPGASKPSSEGAVEPAPQSPGFYSRLFLVQKASGSWRPIIDLSTLNDYVTSSHFRKWDNSMQPTRCSRLDAADSMSGQLDAADSMPGQLDAKKKNN